MTQAFNLSLFANKLNTSGQTDNTGLQNASVTVTAGTGMSGGGAVALGSSVTLTNAGVTSVTAGTGISVSAAAGNVTITNTVSGVTSLNGQTGAITNTDIGVIGSYIVSPQAQTITQYGAITTNANGTLAGSSMRYNYSDGTLTSVYANYTNFAPYGANAYQAAPTWSGGGTSLTGTWRAMSKIVSRHNYNDDGTSNPVWGTGLWVRIS